jgi:hypothetical protein
MERIRSSWLSEELGISHTKIRRWAKEFLPPDPKATLRSGYAREFSLNDAFTIFLGGFLVSELNFSVFEAQKIILTLRPWLFSKGLYPDVPDYVPQDMNLNIREYQISVVRLADNEFLYYSIGRVLRKYFERHGTTMISELYSIESFNTWENGAEVDYDDHRDRRIPMSWLLERFKAVVAKYNWDGKSG